MPHIKFDTPTGPLDVHYFISTPTNPDSPKIVEELPSILFIHSGYIAQEIFEPQFADPALRQRFNLIAPDMRSWGTTVGRVERTVYTPITAADDVARFLDALDLPPLHVFSISIGCTVAVELTVVRPERILSLTLCSPLPTHEPEDIAEGRHQVYRYWSQSFKHDGSTPPGVPLEGDTEMLADLMHGSQELMFNDQINRLTTSLTWTAVDHAMENWAGTPEKLAVAYTVNVEWFLNRKPIPMESLSKVNCPVTIIHCADDIAYPLRYAQDFQSHLQEAGVKDVALCQISGPHFGSVVNPQALNPILMDAVLSASSAGDLTPKHTDPAIFQPGCRMQTPFEEMLARHGYDPSKCGEDSDDDDDDIFITSR